MTALTLRTADAYATWLVAVAEKGATAERHAAYLARVAHAQPLPVVVTRHQCPHCGTTRAKKPAAAAHIGRCWQNPDARGCKTCKFFEPATSEGPYSEHPGWPEECGAGEGIELEHPIVDCSFWQPNAHTERSAA